MCPEKIGTVSLAALEVGVSDLADRIPSLPFGVAAAYLQKYVNSAVAMRKWDVAFLASVPWRSAPRAIRLLP